MTKVLITGGAGFIGSAVVRQFIDEMDVTVINVDKLTYDPTLKIDWPRGISPTLSAKDSTASAF